MSLCHWFKLCPTGHPSFQRRAFERGRKTPYSLAQASGGLQIGTTEGAHYDTWCSRYFTATSLKEGCGRRARKNCRRVVADDQRSATHHDLQGVVQYLITSRAGLGFLVRPSGGWYPLLSATAITRGRTAPRSVAERSCRKVIKMQHYRSSARPRSPFLFRTNV